jgi:hypothetical protein
MKSKSINLLLNAIKSVYGKAKIQPYGTSPEEKHGTGFRIKGVPAIFSVLTLEGAFPEGRYDIQIESDPPGNYVYAKEVDLNEFLLLVERICGPESNWP